MSEPVAARIWRIGRGFLSRRFKAVKVTLMPRIPKAWQRRLVAYVAIYLIAGIVLMGCADRLILFPSHDAIAIDGQHRFEVATARGGLEIWKQRTAAVIGEPRGFVLVFVGNASRAEYEAEVTAEQWRNLPVEIWGVNYPGYGGSADAAKMKNLAPCAVAAYDALSRQSNGRPIFVSGNSIGTTAGLYLAAHRPVAGLVLKNPPPLRQLVLGNYGWWNLWLAAGPFVLQIPRELDSLSNARLIEAPAVFLLADRDTTVPPKYQQKVVSAYGGPHRVVNLKNADHNSSVEGTSLGDLRTQLDWLWQQSAALTK
jgi:hypothetical protein